MTDIFFSYSSTDRDRVQPVHEALEKMGFDVFWDQQVPAGTDWDTWIKDQLKRCRAAIVFWSGTSVASNNVRQEATIASNEGKLVQVMFEPLRPEQFPMGLYSSQATDLSAWQGDTTEAKWALLMRELEVKVTPRWIMQRVLAVEASLKSERQKREAAEAREQALEAQVTREIEDQRALRQARDEAKREADRAKGEAQRATGGSEVGEAALAEVQRRLSEAERARRAAEAKLAARPMRTPRWVMWAAPVVVAGALGAGVGLGRPGVIWPDRAVEVELRLVAAAEASEADRKRLIERIKVGLYSRNEAEKFCNTASNEFCERSEFCSIVENKCYFSIDSYNKWISTP